MGISLSIKAHNPAVASFYIFQMKDQWTMRAEFAWSLRNALIETFPYLNESKDISEADFLDCVKDYLEIKVDMHADGQELVFESIQQIPGDHGHSYTFIVSLDGPVQVSKLQVNNKCMMDMYRKQKNDTYVTTNHTTLNKVFTKHDDEYVFVLEG